MRRRNVSQSLVLVLAMGLSFAFGLLSCFAEESLTITTYYPSPYGSYNELQTNKLCLGDTDGDGVLDPGDQPAQAGDIRLKVYTGNPQTNGLAGAPGEILFSSEDSGSLFLHNGSAWVAQGGGVHKAFFSVKCAWRTVGAIPSCVPPSCPGGWLDSAVGCAVVSIAGGGTGTFVIGGICERWCVEP